MHRSIGRYHPFDGDGMLHAISFDSGAASYRNRFVRTLGLDAENRAGHALWAGLAESPATIERRSVPAQASTRLRKPAIPTRNSNAPTPARTASTTPHGMCGTPVVSEARMPSLR